MHTNSRLCWQAACRECWCFCLSTRALLTSFKVANTSTCTASARPNPKFSCKSRVCCFSLCFVFLCLSWGAGPPCLCHDKPHGVFALEDPLFLTNLPLPQAGQTVCQLLFFWLYFSSWKNKKNPRRTNVIHRKHKEPKPSDHLLLWRRRCPRGCRTLRCCWQAAQNPRQGDLQTGRTRPQICSCQMKWKYQWLDFL